MKVLDLFSGIGGLTLAVESLLGCPTAWFCERDPYAAKILARHWPGVPIIPDVHTVGDVGADVVCGGPPCQSISVAGKQLGPADPRFLWPATVAVVAANRPQLCLFENPTALLSHNGGRTFETHVLQAFAAIGYAVRWDSAEASAAGAPHRRDRAWIVCVPVDGFTPPGPMQARPVSMFGHLTDTRTGELRAVADEPAWPRAGWYAAGRWGEERARWPRGAARGWPTPCAEDPKHPTNGRARIANEAQTGDSRGRRDGTIREGWATPKNSDHRSGKVGAETLASNSRPLQEQAWEASEKPAAVGALNPAFSEWLQGVPAGWTEPDGPALPHVAAGWGGDLVYYGGRPAPRGMALLTTEKKDRRNRLRCLGNSVVARCAILALSELIPPALLAELRQRSHTKDADQSGAPAPKPKRTRKKATPCPQP